MANLLALCVALVALAVVAESRHMSVVELVPLPCDDCDENVQVYGRVKRNAPNIINSVSGLVNGILDTNWKYIAQINANKLRAQSQRRPLIIGPGRNNFNKIMVNDFGWARRN